MAVDLAWVFAGEEGLDGGIEVGLKGARASGDFGDAGDVGAGPDL